MGDIYEILCVTAITAWVISRPLGWFVGRQLGATSGLLIAGLLSLIGMLWPITNWPVALFSPVSLGVAALALADILRPFGIVARRWSLPELTAGLAMYVGYLYASLGGVLFDPYGLGYSGGVTWGVPVALAAYAFGRKDWLLAAVIAGSQALWLAGIGSENLFDHLASLLLFPAILIGIGRRLLARWRPAQI